MARFCPSRGFILDLGARGVGVGAKEQTTAYNLRGTVKVNLSRVTTLDYNRSDMLLLKYAVLEYAA